MHKHINQNGGKSYPFGAVPRQARFRRKRELAGSSRFTITVIPGEAGIQRLMSNARASAASHWIPLSRE
jgi:hypothetical protein